MDPMNGLNGIPMSGVMPMGMSQQSNMILDNSVNHGSNDSPISSPGQPIEDDKKEKKAGRRKINIEFIGDKSRRHITFSKRKSGIMKKAYELSTLTGTQVLLLVASETGHVYTFATPKLQPLITKQEGKTLIQACLNTPDTPSKDTGGNSSTSTPREVVDEKKLSRSSNSSNSSNSNSSQQIQSHAVVQQQQQQQQIIDQIQQQSQIQLQHLKHQATNYNSPQPIQNLSMSIQQQQALGEVYPQQAYGNNTPNNNNSNILYSNNSNLHLPQPNRNVVQQQQAFPQQSSQTLTNLIPHNSPNFSNFSNTNSNSSNNNSSNGIVGNIPSGYGYTSQSPQPFSRSFSQVNSPNLMSSGSSPSTSTPNSNNNTTPPQIIKHEEI